MRRINLIVLFCITAEGFLACGATGQEISRSFEFRYVSDDSSASGETDFKGETAVFDTEDRVEFLHHYAEYARYFFNDPNLDKEVVSNKEVSEFLSKLNEQPLPAVRKRIPLEEWKWMGYRTGEREEEQKKLDSWKAVSGISIDSGTLVFTNGNLDLKRSFQPLSWRFFLQWRALTPRTDRRYFFALSDSETTALTVGFKNNGKIFYSTGGDEVEFDSYSAETWYSFELEVDLSEGRYNFYVDGELKADFVPLQEYEINRIDTFLARGIKGAELDKIWGVRYEPTGEVRMPFTISTFIDEDFSVMPVLDGWNHNDYDDSEWQTTNLPKVHGGERYAGEDLYLRKQVDIGDFSRAVLNVETIDPGGEIWINGEIAAVIDNRHPACIDIGAYLKPEDTNLIAVRVKHFFSERPMGHAPHDRHIGWFAGRMSLDMTSKVYIDDVLTYTQYVSEPAAVRTRIHIKNETTEPFNGHVTVNWYSWFPSENSVPAATIRFPVWVRAWGGKTQDRVLHISNPNIWTFDNPNLYRVEVVLENEAEERVDDYVATTGIRTVAQDGGVFRINGKPEMLNGAQTMGFHVPMDKNATWNRCAPEEWLAKELMMIKRMNGNLLRVHVHAWQGPSGNINDPRIPEMADQLGIMLIWGTTGWIRSLEAFAVDFEGYPKYMRQVYNHPSIVMWEASNHPNMFKKYVFAESDAFCEKVYHTIYPVDPSRLISITSHIGHLHYGNDMGTIDYQGNPAQAAPAWTAPMVTRGNQDSITGYGKEWSVLRTWPTPYHRDFLDSRERAYFNFEHEESIGQPNWSLVKGKPWYNLQSYEWEYDEGSIGRKLTIDEWQESQAWQAFSAYESMRKQRILDYDGFSWCCLHGGANSGTYKKPLTDCYCRAKLAFYTNKMAFQRILAGSDNVDVVYGPDDVISPVIVNLGDSRVVDLSIVIRNINKEVIDRKTYRDVTLPAGRTVTSLPEFKPDFPANGYYAVEYIVE